MTPEKMAELREIESRMTKGPWICGSDVNSDRTGVYEGVVFSVNGDRMTDICCDPDGDDRADDLHGIATLRNAARELLDEIERQAKRIEELEHDLEKSLRYRNSDAAGIIEARDKRIEELEGAMKAAHTLLQPRLDEPDRTVFWKVAFALNPALTTPKENPSC